MRGLLSASHYCNADVFASEQVCIFAAGWVFAGLHQLVASPDQYFTCSVAGRDVVVQNFDGRVRAFENICRHRGKRIQTTEFGKRKLVCAYHGWRYADDGTVATIPFENECYRLEPNERNALRLPEFALEQVGQLLFVSVAESPPSIRHQFDGELLSSLESVSDSFDNEVLVTTIDGRYNWKLAYENLRDSLHPRFVHTTSLNMDVAFESSVSESLMEKFRDGRDVPLSQLSFGGPEGTQRRSRELPFHSTVERWGSSDAYFNWLLYPSTHIVSPDGGHLFSIEHHVPLGPDRTRLTAYFMTGKKSRPSVDVSSVLWAYAQGAKVILDEDTRVMEETQVGLAGGAPTATVGEVEIRNRMTDRWYLNRMGEDGLSV